MRFVLFSLCLWLGLSNAQAAPPSSADIDALLKASGMQTQLDQIPDALRAAGSQQNGLGASIVKPLMDALREVFNPAEMEQMMRVEMIKQLDPTTLAAAMQWFNSADAQAILAAERRMMQPEVLDQIAEVMKTKTVPHLTPVRKQLLQDIDQATGGTDAALDMMMNMQAAFLTAFSHLLMPEQASEFNATLDSFASTRTQYRKLVQDQLLLQQAVLMEPVTDAALVHFRDFARSDAGHKTMLALNNSLNTTIRTIAQRIPAAMAKEEQSRTTPAPVPQAKKP